MGGVRPAVMLAIALVLLACALAVGWLVNGWRLKAAGADAKAAEVEALVEAVREQHDRLGEALGELEAFNRETGRVEHETMDAMSQVQRDLEGVRDAIGESTVGPSGLSADADRLRERAYRAATGAGPATP